MDSVEVILSLTHMRNVDVYVSGSNSRFLSSDLRDVIERNHLRNPEGLKELVRVLASGIGSSTNPTRIANIFQSAQGVTSSTTASRKKRTLWRISFTTNFVFVDIMWM